MCVEETRRYADRTDCEPMLRQQYWKEIADYERQIQLFEAL
jgi:hypothetical protein